MKKILFTLMLLLCTTVVMAQDFVEVSNLEELKAAIDAAKYDNGAKSNAKIKLTANIYLNGMENTLCNTFTGEIDGSYTLKNNNGEDVQLKYAIFGSYLGDEETRKKCSYLFTALDGATIKNVAFTNIRVESEDQDNMGVIAKTATSTTFEQITIDRCSVFTNCNNAGALVGTASSCNFFVVFVTSCDVTTDGVRAGGFVGYSENNKYVYGGASLGTAVFADGNNWTNGGWSGGIAGYSKNDLFLCMANLALVGADQNYVGGYAGESVGSNFLNCHNSGYALHINETDSDETKSFRAIHDKMLAYLDEHSEELTPSTSAGLDRDAKLFACMLNVGGDLDVNSILDLPDNAPLTRGFAAPVISYCVIKLGEDFITTSLGDFIILSGEDAVELAAAPVAQSVGLSFGATCAIAVGVVAVVAAVVIAVYIYNGDDEVGGICGKATNGIFEQCTNTASLKCRDDNCGGIVGLGVGVTINNCLNTGEIGYDEKSTSGSILGKAEANGSKKCVVTNCFSYHALQMVGSSSISSGMSDASGNNYRPQLSEQATCNWEVALPNYDISWNAGLVGYWLNNGVENRCAGIAPWRRSGNFVDGKLVKYPVLDPRFDEITVESLSPVVIRTPDQLSTFSSKVNNGDLFAIAVLADDIDMSGTDWTPIGSSTNRFRGVFDGQGHTIKGLHVNIASDEVGAGLFGVVHNNAIIRNVTVDSSCEFTNTKDGGAAGIVGLVNTGWYWSEVLIENCASYASVSANKHAGGILGRVMTGADGGPSVRVYVNNCCNMGTITATNGNSGLLCGYTKNNGHISNCWSAGSLKTTDNSKYPFSIENPKNEYEYLVGYDQKIDIQNCYILASAKNIDLYDATKMQSGVAAYHSRTVSCEYGTVCLPYALKSNGIVSYYTFSESTGSNSEVTLNFNYAETVAPGTPALFKVAALGTLTFGCAGTGSASSPVAPDEATEWKFTGTYEKREFTGDAVNTIYYISNGAIRHSSTKVTIEPNRAYFVGPDIATLTGSSSAPARVRIVIDGEENEASALLLFVDDAVSRQSAKAYTLYGTEADENYRGIVVREGKKHIVGF